MNPPWDALIFIGHGGVPNDAPASLTGELKRLESHRLSTGTPMTERERALDHQLRHWPRHVLNDGYFAGFESLAEALRQKIPGRRVATAYMEFCAPSIDEAVDLLAQEGHRRLGFITTMVTPGGSHSERDIPGLIQQARLRHPDLLLEYYWPFPTENLVDFFLEQSLNGNPPKRTGHHSDSIA